MSRTHVSWFRWLTAVISVVTVLCGVLLAVEAPSLLVEHVQVKNGQSYSLTYVTGFPVLPVFTVALGVLTFITALKNHRFLLLPFSLGLGLITTVLLAFAGFTGISYGGFHVVKFGFPLGWLAWKVPLPFMEPVVMGVVLLPFLIDLAFWSFLLWLVFLSVNRVSAKLRL
ncbi:MAG: hypothetical protein ACP5PQ_02885 [Thermoproteota archaeon]